MDGNYLNPNSNTWAQNRLLKFVVLVIGVISVWNAFQLERALSSQRTILIPPAFNSPLEISGNEASDITLDAYARYVMALSGNYTPATARRQFNALLSMFSPNTYQRAKAQLYDLAERIEIAKVTNAFVIQKVLASNNEIEIHGINKMFSESSSLAPENKTYIINYEIVDGRFTLLDYNEYEALSGGKNR